MIRADGTEVPFIHLAGWSFEAQLIYDPPLVLRPGDTLRTTCVFDNPHEETVRSGPRTTDEMCFNFLYATPPPSGQFCDAIAASGDGADGYAPGACAQGRDDLLEDLAAVEGAFAFGEAPPLAGGTLQLGRYALADYEVWMESSQLPIGDLDAEASALDGTGQILVVEEGDGTHMVFDLFVGSLIALEGGMSFDRDTMTSLSGLVDTADGSGVATVAPGCGSDEPVSFEYEISEDGESVTLQSTVNPFGVPLKPRMTFVRR